MAIPLQAMRDSILTSRRSGTPEATKVWAWCRKLVHVPAADWWAEHAPHTQIVDGSLRSVHFKKLGISIQEGCGCILQRWILSDLIKGDLIHMDETTINLQKDKGYVWVLASTNSVYFFYRRSREGSFLVDMLREFRGVLVSDFFTAYDSLGSWR